MSAESKRSEIDVIDKKSDLAFYAGLSGFAAIISSSYLNIPGVDSTNFLLLGSIIGESAAIADFVSLEIKRNRLENRLNCEQNQQLQKKLDDLGDKLNRPQR